MNKLSIILLLLAGLMSSCFDDGDCKTIATDILYISFKKYETNEVDTVEFDNIMIEDITNVFNVNDTTTTVLIPLDPSNTSMAINFNFRAGTRELVLDYTTTPRLISEDCGLELLFDNVSADTHDFDSVAVAAKTIDKEITPHLVIYQ